MPHSIDRAYYANRFTEEIERGEQATSGAAGVIHFELAYRYALLAAHEPRERPL